jgi:DNA polymerase III subunit epsilon
LIKHFSTLIKCDREISPFIFELTGISDEMIAEAPRLQDVIDKFIEFVGDDIIIGHNVNFDINFLYDSILQFKNYNLSNDFIDTLRLTRRIIRELDNHRLTTIVYHFGIERNIHRGFEDCEVTNSVYQKIRRLINEDELDSEGNIKPIVKPKDYTKALSTIQPTVEISELFNYINDFFFEKTLSLPVNSHILPNAI